MDSQTLAPQIVNEVFKLIDGLKKDEGMTILLAEQNVKFCLGLSDWAYLLEKGAIQYSAGSEEIAADTEIQMKYLGV